MFVFSKKGNTILTDGVSKKPMLTKKSYMLNNDSPLR